MASMPKQGPRGDLQPSIEPQPKLRTLEALPDAGQDFRHKQRRRMLFAAFLLLLALGVLLVRDWDLWFGQGDTDLAEIETTEAASIAPKTDTNAGPAFSRGRANKHSPVTSAPDAGSGMGSPIITDRKALPPLDVQVVAGGEQRSVQPNNNTIKIEIDGAPEPGPSPILEASNTFPSTNASESVKMSADTKKVLEKPVPPSYPVLARQMKVQGSVAIQALISADGEIQDLRVLSGPSILASAAQEALRQWRFRPYLQNGQPVETQARITVNFTISTF